MKRMVLTGLATEQSFNDPKPRCFLIFNDGELKVQVSEEAAEIVVKEMYSEVSYNEPTTEEETYETTYDNNSYEDEDGIDQV